MLSESYFPVAYSNEEDQQLGEFGVENYENFFFDTNYTMDLFPNLLTAEDVIDLDSFSLLEPPSYEEEVIEGGEEEDDDDDEEGESSCGGSTPPYLSSELNHEKKQRGGAGDRKRNGNGLLSKNAIAARENRIKKKKYVQSLEESVRSITSENRSLKNRTAVLEETTDRLQAEVDYLHGILANVDEISALLKSVRNTSGLKVSCNVKREPEDVVTTEDRNVLSKGAKRKPLQPTEANKKKRLRSSATTDDRKNGGVCFHVNGGQVSLEFCPQCSNNAASQQR